MSNSIDAGGNSIRLGLKYAATHEWIDLSSSPPTVGISDFAQKSLHDVVFVELPKVGQALKKGAPMCTLESIKAVAEAYAPVDGTVAEVNSALESNPELVNKDPYGKGWLIRVEVNGDVSSLLSPEAYAEAVKKQL
jgi:glycine cleavage system H protein